MADQYGMSSALASQKFEQDKELLRSKLEDDKELLRYKDTETPDPQPLDIFNYSQAEPQKKLAAEKPEGFDNLFTPDGKD